MFLYSVIRFVIFPFQWLALKLRHRSDDFVFYEKTGHPTENRPKGDVIWVHMNDFADSGEIVRGLAGNTAGATILLTYNIRDDEYKVNYGPGVICQFAPIDAYPAVRNFLRFWEPSSAIALGSELKPIRQAMLKKLGIPSFLADGKLEDKAYRRWKRMKRLARRTMRGFTFVWAVDNKHALRLANLGAHDLKPQELPPANKIKEILSKIKS